MDHVACSKARSAAHTLVRLSVCALAALALPVLVAPSAVADPPKSEVPSLVGVYQKPVSTRLNSTGRTLTLSLPVKDDGRELGEVVVRIDGDDKVQIPKKSLIAVVRDALEPQTRSRLDALPERGGYIALEALAAADIPVEINRAALEIRLVPKAEQRAEGDVSVARRLPRGASATLARPAIFSGYINLIAGIDHRWSNDTQDGLTSGHLEMNSVFRLWNVVIENDFVYDGRVDTFTCPVGAVCNYIHADGIKRRRSRVVYDWPDRELRLQLGDADVFATSFQRTVEVAGVALEKSPRKLRPGESIRPTGRSSFRIDQPAEVEVLVNGSVITKLRLRPGTHNLTDLPLGTGANDVVLRITDISGAQRTIAFSSFYDATLLRAGASEWSLAGGVPSYFRDGERLYRDDDYLATGIYRRGITDYVTGEVHAQSDRHVAMGGLGVFAMTPWGVLGLEGASSDSAAGFGYALSVNFARSNVWGPFGYWTGLKESLRLGAEYRSREFRAPGEFLLTDTGVIYPQHQYWLRLNGSYSVPLNWGIAASLSGRYQFADEKLFSVLPYTFKGDRYGIDLTLSAPLTSWASGSFTIGYSNETLYSFTTPDSTEGDFRVMARIDLRPNLRTSASIRHDTLNRDTTMSARYESGQGLGRWETSVDVSHYGNDDRALAAAHAAYWGNRIEARVSHMSGFVGTPGQGGNFGQDQRTFVRFGTALVFADGAFAIGPPIRGNGFAIVEAHETIRGKTLTVGDPKEPSARSDWMGPAVLPDLPAYSPRTLPVDVDDLPLGYSLGQGAFETYAPFRGGYRIVIGSAYSVTAYGTLLKADGTPVALLTGTAHQPGTPEKQVAVFTNSAGRFGADGLAPGRWVIEMATEDAPTHYMIDIPKGTDGLFRAGTLTPQSGGMR